MVQGTKLFLEDGSQIGRVTKLTIHGEIGDVWRATVEVIPEMGVWDGVIVNLKERKPAWWRTLLVRLAGGVIDTTDLDCYTREFRKP
jgi:hypothetical protein